MSNKTLTQIRETNRLIESILEQEEGLISPEIEALMNENALALPEKVDGYYYRLKALEGAEEQFKAREKEMQACRKRLENERERLKNYLKFHMDQEGIDSLEGFEYQFKLSNTKASVVLEDENAIPEGFYSEVISKKFDKDEIRKAIEAGLEVPGAKLVPGKAMKASPVVTPKKLKGGAA